MTTDRARHAQLAGAALALRDAVLRYLGARARASAREPLLAASRDAWSFLLRVECCALPLVAQFRRDDLLDRFHDAPRAELLAAESRELQRVLAARLLVRELDAIGERAGLRFTLLKGAAVAADGTQQPVDLGDVDVLTTPEAAAQAWQSLVANGWSPIAPGLDPTDELGPRPHYAPLRSARHQLPLELHERFDYGLSAGIEDAPGTTSIAGYRSIDRLVGPRAIAAILRHSVVVHPHRRGHLRDLFLLAELLRELDDDQRSSLENALRGDAERAELPAMLAQAHALSRREPLPDSDVLRPFVAYKYAVAARTSRLLGTSSPGWNTWSHVPLERLTVRSAAYRQLLREATEPIARDWSPLRHPALASRIAHALALPRLVRVALRVGLVIALIAVGGLIRRHVAALMLTPKGVD